MFESNLFSRRKFLKVSGASAVGLTALGCELLDGSKDPPVQDTDTRLDGIDTESGTDTDTGLPPKGGFSFFGEIFEDPRPTADQRLAALETRWRWLEGQHDFEQFGWISNKEIIPEHTNNYLHAHRYEGGGSWL